MSDPFATLEGTLAHVWQRLGRGTADARDPFRFVTLATVGARGPQARTVGLRRASRSEAAVEVHSDLRTEKVEALRHDPRAEILAWDSRRQVQVRLAGGMTLIPADPDRWARVPEGSRTNYGTDPAPGTPVEAPEAVGRTPEIERFVALRMAVARIDVVSLKHEPHRRALFVAADGFAGAWTAP
ncbi:pyridoxamine 5'-phosphate oxidase family protein [Jannaschia sp. Os4]|uniref:pyridoxamine 5'-phosphate oxidase family protein n=1 Tax=Jannaschia sp. Os4 TaxID=2807617 RepID=UPI00193A7108|nr:pyridoxamine 5'-phosphate oxidase family protein [Jannaschia sp. Os4]MBM2574877.1 pyridoxamine 5'-phosphate oxidase family protein [Jannaschia sp. Os4]